MRRAAASRIATGFAGGIAADVTTRVGCCAARRIAEVTEITHFAGRCTGAVARRAITGRRTAFATSVGARATGARFAAKRRIDCTFPIGSSRTS